MGRRYGGSRSGALFFSVEENRMQQDEEEKKGSNGSNPMEPKISITRNIEVEDLGEGGIVEIFT